jgi:spore coat protein U-like protein
MKRLVFAAVMHMLLHTPAQSQSCTFSMPDINFGNIDLTSGLAYTTSANMVATCTGVAGLSIDICPNINVGSGGVNASGSIRYMLNGANQLQYNLWEKANFTNIWGSYVWGLPPTPPTIKLNLDAAGNGTISKTMYGRIPTGQSALPAGTYTSSFAGGQTRFNYAYSSVGNCSTISSLNLNPVQAPFTAIATNGNGCSVTATDLDFGTQTLLNSNIDQTNTVSVTCATGVTYTVGLDGGLLAAVNPTLRKLNNGTNQITYSIYRDAARSQGWGSTIGTNTVSGTGNGAAQNITGYGRIPPQVTPPASTYNDTVAITVTY